MAGGLILPTLMLIGGLGINVSVAHVPESQKLAVSSTTEGEYVAHLVTEKEEDNGSPLCLIIAKTGKAIDAPCSRCSSCNVVCKTFIKHSSESITVENAPNPQKISVVPALIRRYQILESAPSITPERAVTSTGTKKTTIDSQTSRKSTRRSTTKAVKRATLTPVGSSLTSSISASSNKTTGPGEPSGNVRTTEPDSIQPTMSEMTEWNGTENEINETEKVGILISFQSPRKRRRNPGRYTHKGF
ncbi:unnamed protein product [Anisakis simplex]|uniref:4Fe-4S ferredoxin-type domain-containing protein n=1 Tax=Anisakis simplex TaxID=6269 RepID=A0A0M3KBG2_ANISI|nr:unnamed protein product [Anisakis simplex]